MGALRDPKSSIAERHHQHHTRTPSTSLAMSTASKKAISDVWKACAEISGADPASQPDSDTSLFDMGLDSLGLAELVIQLEEVYGEGSLTVDDILAQRRRGENVV